MRLRGRISAGTVYAITRRPSTDKPTVIPTAKLTHRATATFKPTPIPAGFVLVIDTREQQPLFTGKAYAAALPVEHRAIETGDYTIAGHEGRVAIERKKMSDLYAYLGAERRKTRPKLEKLGAMDWAALIIEASEADLARQYKYSTKLTPEHVRGFLTSVRVRYGIHVYMSSVRSALERYVLDSLVKWYELHK